MNGLIHVGVDADAVDIIIALMIMLVLLAQYIANSAHVRAERRGGVRI